MKLKNKIALISAASIILFCIITFTIQKTYIVPTYNEIETSEAGKDICQVTELILNKELKLYSKTNSLAKKITGRIPYSKNGELDFNKGLKRYLTSVVKFGEFDFCYLFDREENLKFNFIRDKNKAQVFQLLENCFKLNSVIYSQKNLERKNKSGMLSSSVGVIMLSSVPIQNDGKLGATLIMGYFLDKKFTYEISRIVRAPVKLHKLNRESNILKIGSNKNVFNGKFSIYYSKVDANDESMQASIILPDINEKPRFLLTTQLSRLIYLEAHYMIVSALYALIILGVLLIFITLFIVHIIVVKPITKLTQSTVKIRTSENLSLRTEFEVRKDEIGTLSGEFNILLQELQHHIEDMEDIIRKQTKEIRMTREDTIFRISMAIDDKNIAAGRHITRVSKMVILLSEKLDINRKTREIFGVASTMHDIGKIGVPEEIVTKSGKYTEEEFNAMKSHTVIGGKIFENGDSELLKTAHDIAKYHHERWDGTGYPERLKETEIPLAARITSIVDIFDAFLSKKTYKEAHSLEDTISFFKENRGKIFDPGMVDVFLENINAFTEIREKYPDNF